MSPGAVKRRASNQTGPSYVTVKTDWKSYFNEFDKLHGKNTGPIHYGKRLLYPDGWMYANNDYRGPEWRPPSDAEELRKLKKTYWSIFHGLVTQEIRLLEDRVREIKASQQQRSAPLQAIITYLETDEEGNRKVKQKKDALNPELFEGRLIWLRGHLEDCKYNLKVLTVKGEQLIFDISEKGTA